MFGTKVCRVHIVQNAGWLIGWKLANSPNSPHPRGWNPLVTSNDAPLALTQKHKKELKFAFPIETLQEVSQEDTVKYSQKIKTEMNGVGPVGALALRYAPPGTPTSNVSKWMTTTLYFLDEQEYKVWISILKSYLALDEHNAKRFALSSMFTATAKALSLFLIERKCVQEGIFRVPTDSGEVFRLLANLYKMRKKATVPENTNVHCAAGAFKLLFRSLPESVLGNDSAIVFGSMHMDGQEVDDQEIMDRLCELPKRNLILLSCLSSVLSMVLLSKKSNLMSLKALDVVWKPNLVPPQSSLSFLMKCSYELFLKYLIKNRTKLFGPTIPQEEVTFEEDLPVQAALAQGDDDDDIELERDETDQLVDDILNKTAEIEAEVDQPVTPYRQPLKHIHTSPIHDDKSARAAQPVSALEPAQQNVSKDNTQQHPSSASSQQAEGHSGDADLVHAEKANKEQPSSVPQPVQQHPVQQHVEPRPVQQQPAQQQPAQPEPAQQQPVQQQSVQQQPAQQQPVQKHSVKQQPVHPSVRNQPFQQQPVQQETAQDQPVPRKNRQPSAQPQRPSTADISNNVNELDDLVHSIQKSRQDDDSTSFGGDLPPVSDDTLSRYSDISSVAPAVDTADRWGHHSNPPISHRSPRSTMVSIDAKELADLRSKLQSKRDVTRRSLQTIKKLKSDLADAKAKSADTGQLQSTIAELRNVVAEQTEELAVRQEEIDLMTEQVHKAEQVDHALQTARSDVALWKQRYGKLHTKHSETSGRHIAEIRSLKGNAAELNNRINTLTKRNKVLEHQLHAVREQQVAHQNLANELGSDGSLNASQLLEPMTARVKKLQEGILRLRDEKSQIHRRLVRTMERNAELEQAVSEMKSQVHVAHQDQRKLQRQLELKNQNILELQQLVFESNLRKVANLPQVVSPATSSVADQAEAAAASSSRSSTPSDIDADEQMATLNVSGFNGLKDFLNRSTFGSPTQPALVNRKTGQLDLNQFSLLLDDSQKALQELQNRSGRLVKQSQHRIAQLCVKE